MVLSTVQTFRARSATFCEPITSSATPASPPANMLNGLIEGNTFNPVGITVTTSLDMPGHPMDGENVVTRHGDPQ